MDPFSGQELKKYLTTRVLGRRAVLLDSVDSTNAEVRRRLEKQDSGGILVIANEQTGGRGRRGRAWVSRRDCGLWMTLALKPGVPADELQKTTLLAGLAVCRAVVELTDGRLKPQIKWPNDVLSEGRKLCGILCETATDAAGERAVVMGIGVNTKTPEGGWREADPIAVSLEQASGVAIPRMRLASAILNHLEGLLDAWRAEGFAAVAAGYREYMLPPGSAISVVEGGQTRPGVIEGLDDAGGLLVRLDGGETARIVSGEISVRGVEDYV